MMSSRLYLGLLATVLLVIVYYQLNSAMGISLETSAQSEVMSQAQSSALSKTALTTAELKKTETTTKLPRLIAVASPLYAYREIVDRPLFNQSRRPAAKSAVVTPTQPSDVDLATFPWQLSGISIRGKNRTALVWHKNLRQSFTLQEQASEQGWTVKTIQPDSVLMQNDNNKMSVVELKLRGQIQPSQ